MMNYRRWKETKCNILLSSEFGSVFQEKTSSSSLWATDQCSHEYARWDGRIDVTTVMIRGDGDGNGDEAHAHDQHNDLGRRSSQANMSP